MREKLSQLLEIVRSPNFEDAIAFLLVMNQTDRAFKAAGIPLADDPIIELAKESIGKSVFKTPKPKFGGQEFMELPREGFIHGAMILEGCNVIMLYFREHGQGVGAIYEAGGKRKYLRVTKVDDGEQALEGAPFVPNNGSVN